MRGRAVFCCACGCVRPPGRPQWPSASLAIGRPRTQKTALLARTARAGTNQTARHFHARTRGARRYRTRTRKAKKKNEKGTARAQCARARKQRRVLTHCAHVIIHMPTCQETTLAHEECPLADQSTGGHAPLGPPSAAPLRQQLAPASRFLSSTKSIQSHHHVRDKCCPGRLPSSRCGESTHRAGYHVACAVESECDSVEAERKADINFRQLERGANQTALSNCNGALKL